jgi:TrmH RNA methyltransferase
MKDGETKIYGKHACRAVFEKRPDDIIRVLLDQKSKPYFRELLDHCVAQRKTYRVVSTEELEKVSGARHHEGICIVTLPKWSRGIEQILSEEGAGLILALDQVSNPHNIGTLLRTAAHFGARAVFLSGKLRRLSAAAYRTAEGAAEYMDVVFEEEMSTLLQACKEAKFSVCATSSHKGASLYEQALPARAVILLGAERDGLSKTLMGEADCLISIPGTSNVESLNVASSAAVFMAEHWRLHASAQV